MRKFLFVFLLFLFSTNAFAGYGGYVGTHDNRRYGSLSEPEYNGVIKIMTDGFPRGTGVFVSKNIILTNSHVAMVCKNGCVAEFWNGSGYETANLKILVYNEKSNMENGTDWGLLLSDKESNFYKPIAPMSTTGQVQRGGYGCLRVIDDDEIPFLKSLYAEAIAEHEEECSKEPSRIECFNRRVDEKLEKLGKKQLFKDWYNFKVQTCNIVGDSKKSNKMMKTDCDSSGGDSGTPLLRNNAIVGLNNSGRQDVFGDTDVGAEAIKTEVFYIPVQGFINEYNYKNAIDPEQKYIGNEK